MIEIGKRLGSGLGSGSGSGSGNYTDHSSVHLKPYDHDPVLSTAVYGEQEGTPYLQPGCHVVAPRILGQQWQQLLSVCPCLPLLSNRGAPHI